MSVQYGNSVPGIRSDRTHTPRIVLLTDTGAEWLPGGKVIDGSKARDSGNTGDLPTLRPGLLMGKITASGKYAPTILGVVASAYSSGGTSITVSAAQAVEIVRRIGGSGTLKYVGPPSAAGTVAVTSANFSAVNTTTGVITTSDLGADKIAGTLVVATDGTEVPLGILDEFVRVTDVDGNNLTAQMSRLLVAGFIDTTKLIDYPTDTSLKAYVKGTWLNAPTSGCGTFKFSDNF